MTDRSIIGKEQVAASGRTAPGSATKATRHAGARHKPISAEERERLIAIEAYSAPSAADSPRAASFGTGARPRRRLTGGSVARECAMPGGLLEGTPWRQDSGESNTVNAELAEAFRGMGLPGGMHALW